MTRSETLGRMLFRGFLPIILPVELSATLALEQIYAVGLETVEFSARRHNVLQLVAQTKRSFPRVAVGVSGLVEDGRVRQHLLSRGMEMPSLAEAGADFLSSNVPFTAQTYERYRDTHILMPGVSTPGEAMAATDLGANLLRFTVPHVAGGMGYLRALDQLTSQSLPICTVGPVRFELQAG